MTASDETMFEESSRGGGRPPAAVLAAGAKVGRYTVLERLGAGGMGIVYAAYDPELNRRVAIKLVQRDVGSTLGSQGRRRLLREAQAMARLSHPNVITVHDVGETDGAVFIAMEYVEGQTLTAWLKAPRAWIDVLSVFRQAGEGLAAAHRVGLIHRDFKPDNVMLDGHGRVRVLDFGLARAAELDGQGHVDALPEVPSEAALRVTDDAFSTDLTREGAVMGTPRYMAPEQHLGARADEAADQFSFCVALYEALFGQRPFEGDNAAMLAISVTSGRVRGVPANSPVPARIRGAIVRGLAAEPRDRFPSMRVLLDELARAEPSRSRVWLPLGVGLGVIACVAGVAWISARTRADHCATLAHAITEVWTPEARARIEAAFHRSRLPLAEQALARTLPALAAFSEEWTAGRELACKRRELEPDALAMRRQICFEQARRAYAITLRELAQADDALVLHAAQGLGALPRLRECEDEAVLVAAIKPVPSELEGVVAAARERLTEAQTLRDLGRYEAAAAQADAVLTQLGEVDYAPLAAEAEAIVGDVASFRGESERAREHLEAAYFLAGALGHDKVAFKAAIDLTWVLGVDLQRPPEGHAWARHAAMMAERLGDGADLRERIAVNRGGVLWQEGKLTEAAAAYRKAIALSDERDDAAPEEIARNLVNLGLVLHDQGEDEQALEHLRRGLDVQERELGPEHPDLHATLNNIGNALSGLGRYDEAIAALERSLAIVQRTFGEAHPSVASARQNIAIAMAMAGQHEAAVPEFERAHAIRVAALGADSPQLANSHVNLAIALGLVDRHGDALTHLERARVLFALAGTNAHPGQVALLEFESGQVYRELDRLPEALAASRSAVERFEAMHGTDAEHPQIAQALASLAETELRMDLRDDARGHFERALAIGKLPPDVLAPIQFGVARTLPAREQARARELVEAAIAGLAGRTDRRTAAHVDAMQTFLEGLE